jgi:hypothetical protein
MGGCGETLRVALNGLVAGPQHIARSRQLQADALIEGGTNRAADLIENTLTA